MHGRLRYTADPQTVHVADDDGRVCAAGNRLGGAGASADDAVQRRAGDAVHGCARAACQADCELFRAPGLGGKNVRGGADRGNPEARHVHAEPEHAGGRLAVRLDAGKGGEQHDGTPHHR